MLQFLFSQCRFIFLELELLHMFPIKSEREANVKVISSFYFYFNYWKIDNKQQLKIKKTENKENNTQEGTF